MALPLDVQRAASYGISSPYTPADMYFTDPTTKQQVLNTSKALMALKDLPGAILDIRGYYNKHGVGYGKMGVDTVLLYSMYPVLFWFVGFMVIRYLCREPLARLGVYAGVVSENKKLVAEGKSGSKAVTQKSLRKVLKFQNQVWLAAFYVASTAFGYYVQHDKPWFGLPINYDNAVYMVLPHPYNPPQELVTYYYCGLAFYLSEAMSLIFLESQMKRSDFLEYVIHHAVTIFLLTFSHAGWNHRMGVYVLFIHDASDIMLCVAKSIHYVVDGGVKQEKQFLRDHPGQVYRKTFFRRYLFTETVTNICFVLFIAAFFFFRLCCLPMLGIASVGTHARLISGTYMLWAVVGLCHSVLQALHVYWSALIVNMVIRLTTGGERNDIRSEEDEDDSCGPVDGAALRPGTPLPNLSVSVTSVQLRSSPRESSP